MIVTLPLILILLDFWPLKRIPKKISFFGSIKEKVPFFIFTLISCVLTMQAQSAGGATANLQNINVDMRIANAAISYVIYIIKFFWPTGLAIFHPYIEYGFIALPAIGSYVVLSALFIFFLKQRENHLYLSIGFFWYLITLVPVIGLVQVGAQQYAERYTYIPYIGLSIIVAWGANFLIKRFQIKKVWIWFLAVLVVLLLSFQTWKNVKYWKNGIELYEHTLKVTKNNYLAHLNLGHAYLAKGDFNKMKENIEKSIAIRSNIWNTHSALGIVANHEGKHEEALGHFRRALELKPDNGSVYFNIGVVYQGMEQSKKAEKYYLEAIKKDPHLSEAHYKLAFLYFDRCDIANSKKYFKKTLEIDPDNRSAQNGLSNLKPFEGKTEEEQEKLCKVLETTGLVKKISKLPKKIDTLKKIPKVRKAYSF